MDRQAYLHECRTIQVNAEHTAEAHHIDARKSNDLALWFSILPASAAAIGGGLIGSQIIPTWWGWLAAIAAVTAAISGVIDPKQRHHDHLSAAKEFTAIKHDARMLREATATRASDEELNVAVVELHGRYNKLVKIVPPTSPSSFKEARENIRRGVHEPN